MPAPTPVKVELTPALVDQAWTEAIFRQANAQARQAATNNPASRRLEFLWHVRGALCEIAVAHYLDLEWTGRVGNTTDGTRHDVGNRYEVRSAGGGPLRFWPKDYRHTPDTPFVLCHHGDPLAERPGPVTLIGWISIGDGDEQGRPGVDDTVLVDHEHLHDVRLLGRHDTKR